MKVQMKSSLVWVALAIGVASSLWGFSHLIWRDALPIGDPAFQRNFSFFLAFGLVVAISSRLSRSSPYLVSVVLGLFISLFAGALWPLLVALWFALSSSLLGKGIFTAFRIGNSNWILSFLVGAGIYGSAVGLLAHFPVNYPGVYGAALIAPLILGWRPLQEWAVAVKKHLSEHRSEEFHADWPGVFIVTIALIHFIVAFMPEVGHDALAMHLFIPAHLATRHVWGFDVDTYVWAVMPMMGDWLFSMGYMLAGETAARLINVGFIFVLSWLVRDLVIWAGGSALGARWAVLLFLTTPLTFTESSSLFIESVWAAFIVAGALSVFKLIQNQQSTDQAAQLKVAGLLLGAATAAKAVSFTILPVLLLLLALRYRTWGQRKLLSAITLGLILFIAVGGIPYATAWLLTGNPVFPFFNQIFKSTFWPAVAFEAPTVFGKGLSWDVIYKATFYTGGFLESKPGAPGFHWLLLFIPSMIVLLISRQYKGILLFAVAGLCIALTFQSITYLRYIFPSFVWVAAGIGVALSSKQTDAAFTRRVLSVVGWAVVSLNLVFFKSGTYYGDLSLQPLTGQTGRETYLNNRLPIRSAIELVNQINMGRAPVAVFSSPLTAGLNSDGLYPNWYNHQFQTKVTAATTSGHIAQLLMDKGVNYVILDSNWGANDKRKIIEDATEKISEHGSITVRKLKSSYKFQTELLKNPDFSSYNGWTFPVNTYEQTSDQITVSVSSPSSQLTSVVAGRRYQNSVTAFCKAQPTQGRVQVNWLDSESKFISTDIRVYECTPTATTHAMEVTAPRNASKAAVYATGHTNIPIIISKVSFKQ